LPVVGLVLVAALGLAAYHVIASPRHPPGRATGAAARLHQASHHQPRHPPRATPPQAPATVPVRHPYAHKIVIRLIATAHDCWVGFTTPGGHYLSQSYLVAGTAKRWAFGHAVDMRVGHPGGITLTVDGKNPLPPGTTQPITLHLRLHAKIRLTR
jgi:hypothetical protein